MVYRDELTIERINNDGNYEPSNCRWATTAEQSLNTRQNRIVIAWGETKTMVEWSEDRRCRVAYHNLRYRLNHGWEPEVAVSTPLIPPRYRNRNAEKTHCVRGHEFTPGKTLIHSDGSRHCLTCRTGRSGRQAKAPPNSSQQLRKPATASRRSG
jgi:hypothetical protein